MSDTYPIEAVNLCKRFGTFTALDDFNLQVRRNSFTGLLGPNGAGKSTCLKIFGHLHKSTSGHAYINGYDVEKEPKQALTGMGSVIETPEFYLYMTPRETFRFTGDILGMKKEAIDAETDEILEKVKMTEWADKRLGTFSKGMRQRISLGLALMNSPEVIILDEPTSGLDPRGMAETREILRNLRTDNNGLTVLMSSHMMYEVSDLCDRIAMVNHGKLLVHDDIYAVLGEADHRNITVRTKTKVDADMLASIESLTNVVSATKDADSIRIQLKGGMDEESLLFTQIGELGIGAYSMSEGVNALEDRYLELIKESR
ncbi:MAG: ABC transporter ATP-binding protein [Candidatus Methanomethylophilaceae archaeon]|nr:ABC transporter ATP-binding protein [Candidatus Methanomethylophilaceae archaeon]